MPEQLTLEELVKALRLCAKKTENGETCITGQKDCPFGVTVLDCTERMNLAARSLLESLAAERDGYKEQLAAALAENTKLAEQVQANRRAQQPNEPLTLPAAVGQTVYHYCAETNHIIQMTVSRIEVKEHGIYCFAHDASGEQYRVCILDNGRNDFKTRVALTFEAAEQALAYRHPPEAGEKE